jgi:hypothetical protein
MVREAVRRGEEAMAKEARANGLAHQNAEWQLTPGDIGDLWGLFWSNGKKDSLFDISVTDGLRGCRKARRKPGFLTLSEIINF